MCYGNNFNISIIVSLDGRREFLPAAGSTTIMSVDWLSKTTASGLSEATAFKLVGGGGDVEEGPT